MKKLNEMAGQNGYTLVEVMIALVVLSILVAIAVPSFSGLMQRNQVGAAANDLIASLLTARSEAVKREVPVAIENDGGWDSGWTVTARDPAGDIEILSYAAKHADLTISANGNLGNGITFRPSGRATNALSGADYFQITLGEKSRCITFSTTGRPTVEDCP